MPDQKLRIFISSTIADLRRERATVAEGLGELEIFEVVRSESLPAGAESSEHVCLDEVRAADAIILIVGARYGFIPSAENPGSLSVTHMELRHARALRKPVFAFIRSDVERDSSTALLLKEVGDFTKGLFWREWTEAAELREEARRSLLHWLAREVRARRWPASRVGRESILRAAAEAAPISISTTAAEDFLQQEDGAAWMSAFCGQLEKHLRECIVVGSKELETNESGVSIRISSADGAVEVAIEHRRQDSAASLTREDLLLRVEKTEEGRHTAAEAALGVSLLASEDPDRAVHFFLRAATRAGEGAQARKALLLQSAKAAVQCVEVASAIKVAREVLRTAVGDEELLQWTTLGLLAAQREFDREHATKAFADAQRLLTALIVRSLASNGVSAEALYSLARANLRGPYAIAFYDELLRMYPEYESRWYVHRDLGLAYYHLNQLPKAAEAYERAARLKGGDAELARYSGDALFYQGKWASAIGFYRSATLLDGTQDYYVADKVAFSEARVRLGSAETSAFLQRRRVSALVLKATRLCGNACSWVQRLSLAICHLNAEASCALALTANRRGDYVAATRYLRIQLAASPENASARLNLVGNLLFLSGGTWTDTARDEFTRAAFHGGPRVEQEIFVRLSNSPSRSDLMGDVPGLIDRAKTDYELHARRRADSRRPEYFGATLHVEL